jgi:hypothetical protein
MKVTQMISKSGNAVANQFILSTPEFRAFQSYDSIIVKRTGQNIELDERYWNYSKTTSKYRSQFLGETTKETQEKIDNGTYTLTNLN